MILEVEIATNFGVRVERHAVLISERGILHSFRSVKREFLRNHNRILKVIITPDEEMEMLEDVSLSSSVEFAWFTGRHHGQLRSLEGVPLEVQEPLALAKIREIRERLIQQVHGPVERRFEAIRVLFEAGAIQMDPISPFNFYKQPEPPSCRQCGQTTEHFFTSQRDQSALCEACFGEREAKQLAKQVTKSKHPLDAWMGT